MEPSRGGKERREGHVEREQEKFSGEWAGTTRPSNQSLDYSRVVGVCGGAHTVVSRVSLTLPFSSFLSSTVLSSPLLDPTTVRPPFLSTTIASSPLPPSVLLPPLVLSEVSSHSSCPTGGGRRRLSSFSSFACLRASPPSSPVAVLFFFFFFFFFPRHFCLRHGFLLVDKEPGTDRFLAVFPVSRLRA